MQLELLSERLVVEEDPGVVVLGVEAICEREAGLAPTPSRPRSSIKATTNAPSIPRILPSSSHKSELRARTTNAAFALLPVVPFPFAPLSSASDQSTSCVCSHPAGFASDRKSVV